MKLIELLNLLLSFGPKLPAVIAEIEIIVAAFQRIAALFASPKFAAKKPVALNAKESALLAKVLAAAGGKKTKFGGPFTNIFAWLKANPQYLTVLLTLLKLL